LIMAKRIKGESGYSLIEVMVSIIIMALAILPMVAMFDMGLNSTTVGSNYDKARMLANVKLEEAKNLPYDTVRNNFPEPVGGTTTTPDPGSGFYESGLKTEPGADFANLEYRVEKQYMVLPCRDPATGEFDPDCASWDFIPSESPDNTGLIRVKVTVEWTDTNNNLRSYETFGLVAQ
jgi:prepilin-type N-terminal cleavage/methylation domain-containing protein